MLSPSTFASFTFCALLHGDFVNLALARTTIGTMITPSPTTSIDPVLARGTLLEIVPESGQRPAHLTFAVPNTSYQIALLPIGAMPTPDRIGKRLIGTIRAKARRIDVVDTGGRYLEPVYGRPRRIQGTIIKTVGDALVIDAGVPIHCTPTDPRQSASQFQPGQLVSFDALDGATFEPSAHSSHSLR